MLCYLFWATKWNILNEEMHHRCQVKLSQVCRTASLIEMLAWLFYCLKLSNISYGLRHRSVNPWSKNRIEVTDDWSLFEIGGQYVLSLVQYSCTKLLFSFLFFSPPLLFSFPPLFSFFLFFYPPLFPFPSFFFSPHLPSTPFLFSSRYVMWLGCFFKRFNNSLGDFHLSMETKEMVRIQLFRIL